jgi:hypothetical protein
MGKGQTKGSRTQSLSSPETLIDKKHVKKVQHKPGSSAVPPCGEAGEPVGSSFIDDLFASKSKKATTVDVAAVVKADTRKGCAPESLKVRSIVAQRAERSAAQNL